MLSQFTHVQFCATQWTVTLQAPLNMEFSRQEFWSGLPFPSPGDLPDPGAEPASLESHALAGELFISAAAAAASLQSCLMLCDPIDGSPLGFPSLVFSRQEHWSGLPFPSPMYESEK